MKPFSFLLAAAALAAASLTAHAQAPAFRLCTGADTGNYFKAGHILKNRTGPAVAIDVVPTAGSIANLDAIVGKTCDGGFVQSDAMLVYSARNARAISALERAGVLYQEQVHLVCNRRANIGRVVDLTKQHTVAVGSPGSGGGTTWDAFVLADAARYKPVQTDARGGLRALAAASDGSQVTCVLWVGALGSSFMKNDAQARGDDIVLVGTDDRDMTRNAKDAKGQPVYSYGEIPTGAYPRIQPEGTIYGTKAVPTVKVDALFVVSTDWINANERAYDTLLRTFAGSKAEIGALVGQ